MAISVNGINGTDYATIIGQTQSTDLENSLSNMSQTQATNDEMMEACKEFEQYMIEQVYKAMEKTIIKADDEENDYEQYFGDMRIQEYAEMVTEQGTFGLAQQLYEAMQRNQGTTLVVEQATETTVETTTEA